VYGVNTRPFEIQGELNRGHEFPRAQFFKVSPGYFRVLGTPPTAGRDFDARDRAASPPVAIVNERFAATYWPGELAVGQRLRSADPTTPVEWRTVVGVVPNVMQGEATRQEFKPLVYVPFEQEPAPRRAVFLARTSVPPEQLVARARAEIEQSDPDVQLEDVNSLKARFAFDRDFMDWEHSELGKHAKVAPIFAVVALLLAAIGLAAVIAHSVSQRTKEIGVRMAIGAGASDIRRLILSEGMTPVAVGVLLGLAASVALNRLLQSQLVGVSPDDPLTIAGAPALLMIVALFASLVPVRRAVQIEPAVALRHE
jgi:predicted permease